jgi:hypothetical protein
LSGSREQPGEVFSFNESAPAGGTDSAIKLRIQLLTYVVVSID